MRLDAETLLAHGAWLARLARALVARDDELEDVVQQTYARALERPPRHARNLRGWLGAVARNVVRSNARSDTARVAREIALPPPPPVETPHEAVERAELRRLVVESVLALDEPYRSVVILRFFEEQDVATIARLTSAGEETVRTRLRRGVLRVRELLERKAEGGSRDADEGAAARALLLLRLREIAAGSGGGATGSAAAARGFEQGPGSFVGRAVSRRVLVPAVVAVVLAGSWWWIQNVADRETLPTEAVRLDPPTESPAPSEPAPAPVAVERNATESAAPPPAPPALTPPAPPRRSTQRGSIRGTVTDPDGKPVAGASVWAMQSGSHEVDHTMPRFGSEAPGLTKAPPSPGTSSTTSDAQGRYEFAGLSVVPAWHVGAYEPTLGATVSPLLEFDSRAPELACDLRLIQGTIFRGSVCDEEGEPIGFARVELFALCGEAPSAATLFAEPYGESLGEFDAGFRCGEELEFSCSAPGFLPSERRKVELVRGTKETRVDVTLERRPGIVVRGRIVDAAGNDLDLEEFADRLLAEAADAKYLRLAVFAIAEGIAPPPGLAAGGATGAGIVEGRVDFPAGRYDVVVPEGFRGSLELRLARFVLGGVALPDANQPPDLPCDEGRLSKPEPTSTFVVQFVDQASGQPIDLEQHKIKQLVGTTSSSPFFDSEVDGKRGLVRYRAVPGSRELVTLLVGYAAGHSRVDVRPQPTETPITIELMKADSGAHGFAFRSDGTPLAKAVLGLFCPTPSGMIDLLGPSRIATSADGELELEPLPAREHVLVVSSQPDEAPVVVRFVPADPPIELTIHAVAGTPTELRVIRKGAATRPSKPRLRILDSDGIVLEDSERIRAIRTEAPDVFVATLAPGRYSARVDCSGFASRTVTIDVPVSGPIEIPIEPAAPPSK